MIDENPDATIYASYKKAEEGSQLFLSVLHPLVLNTWSFKKRQTVARQHSMDHQLTSCLPSDVTTCDNDGL